MDLVFSVPVITSILLALFGIVLFIYRETITGWFNRTSDVSGANSPGLEWVRQVLLQFSGADIWVVTGVYVGLTLAILASTGMMVMRFLRD